jgi:hypothetical protein
MMAIVRGLDGGGAGWAGDSLDIWMEVLLYTGWSNK